MSESSEGLEQKLEGLKIDRDAPRRRGFRPWWAFLSIAVVAGIAIVVATILVFQRNAPIEVESAVARAPQVGSVEGAVLDGTGYVVARRQATVSSKATGKVLEVFIEEGMVVEEGQLLATLDDSVEQTQYDLSAAQLAETEARLTEVKVQIAQAEQDVKRIQDLAQDGFASESELDNARLALDSFEAQRERLEKTVDVSKTALELQRKFLDDMKIRAPFTGIVIAKAAQPGEMISPVSGGGGFTRTGICTIVDMESIEVQVDVNEKYINRVSPDQPATVTLNSYPDTRLPASVIAIIPTADRARSTVRVRIRFLEKDERVLPDMGVSVSFLEEGTELVREDIPTGVEVPANAVLNSGEDTFVWVVENKSVSRRTVTVAGKNGSRSIISDGLERGEVVVTDLSPQVESLLSNGQSVVLAD